MGLVDLTSVEIKESGPNFEKFDVEKNDKALIHIPNGNIVQEFVHVFHRDEPVMVERNGKQVPQWSRESFAGTYICTGEFDTVMQNPRYGDPGNCPACRAMNKGPKLFETPKRTFALNVVRYATNKRSYDLRNDNVEVQLWRHADVRKLEPILTAAAQLKEEGKKINHIDFCVEADNSDWKKYMISPSMRGLAFQTNDTIKANMKAAYDDLYPETTLTDACGRKLDAEQLQAEVDRVIAEFQLETSDDGDDLFESTNSTTTSEASPAVDVTEKTTEDDLTTVPVGDLDDLNDDLFD